MRKDKGGEGGTIINIASVSALSLLSPNAFVYGATKAGVLHFTTSVGVIIFSFQLHAVSHI